MSGSCAYAGAVAAAQVHQPEFVLILHMNHRMTPGNLVILEHDLNCGRAANGANGATAEDRQSNDFRMFDPRRCWKVMVHLGSAAKLGMAQRKQK